MMRLAVSSSCAVLVAGTSLRQSARNEEIAFRALVEAETAESSEWRGQCDTINSDCEDKKAEFKREVDANIAELEAEYQKQNGILEGKVADHAAEKKDVVAQSKIVSKEAEDVKAAKVTVAKFAHCPPELEQAKARLAGLKATPDKTANDVDAECKVQKEVLKLEDCTAQFNAAQKVLTQQTKEHTHENDDLNDEQSQERTAAGLVPPSEATTADAKAAWLAAKKKGYAGIEKIEAACQADRDALEANADDEIRALADDYSSQKAKLADLQGRHKAEKADVVEQKKSVVREQKDITPAQKAVDKKSHCPADLEAAEAELARLTAIPNKTPEDVDKECKVRKQVLELKQCVQELRAAEQVLSKETSHYTQESSELREESKQEADAADLVPPQQAKVNGAESALKAAQAARKGICKGPHEDEPKPVKKAPAKSGASRAAVATSLALAAAFLSTLLQA
jgi:hypothetical protein